MIDDNYKHSELTSKIIKSFYKVYNKLGHGFLEKVYENSMMIELEKHGLLCKKQVPIEVYYDGSIVGEYYADIVVNDIVIVELKAVKEIIPIHHVQLVNYLKATRIEVGLLLNFGIVPQQFRRVLTAEK